MWPWWRPRCLAALAAAAALAGLAGCRTAPGSKPASASTLARPSGGWPEALRAVQPRGGALAGFGLAEEQARRFSHELTLTNGLWTVKVEIIQGLTPESAQTVVEDGVMGVQALYANALSPYPGDISRTVVSDSRYRPELVRLAAAGGTAPCFLLHANERFGFGASTADTVRYRALAGWLRCAQAGVLYKVRVFAPLTARREELLTFFQSLACP